MRAHWVHTNGVAELPRKAPSWALRASVQRRDGSLSCTVYSWAGPMHRNCDGPCPLTPEEASLSAIGRKVKAQQWLPIAHKT